MKPVTRLRRDLARILLGIDPKWNRADVTFRAGMVLAASAVVGTVEAVLAEVTGEPIEFVRTVAARCRKNRIWRGDMVRVYWEGDADASEVAFVADVLVASGDVIRPTEDKVSQRSRAKREEWKAAGVCVNCGRERDRNQTTCSKCAESVKVSAQRRAQRAQGGAFISQLKHTDPLYQIASKE